MSDGKIDELQGARMVDVSSKDDTVREAAAQAVVRMSPETAEKIYQGSIPKGDVLATAKIAAIMATKRTPDVLPLCHPIAISGVDVEIDLKLDLGLLEICVTVRSVGKTGVEMEALTGASIAALCVYDMCKSLERGIVIEKVILLAKSGGRSGNWVWK